MQFGYIQDLYLYLKNDIQDCSKRQFPLVLYELFLAPNDGTRVKRNSYTFI